MLFLLYIPYYIYRKNKSKRKEKEKEAEDRRRERNRAKDAAAILASSSPLFRSACCLTVRTIASAHPLTQSHPEADGRPPRPLLGDVIATPRHRPDSNQQRGSASNCLPSCRLLLASRCLLLFSVFLALISSARSCLTFCPPLPLCQVVRGRADHQPGQAIPSRSSCRPSPPLPGRPTAPRLALLEVLGAYSTDPDELTLSQAKQCGGAVLLESVLSRENLRGCISLNINYLFSPKG